MLVKNGFADAGPVSDLVHAGCVVAAIDEDLAGSDQQLSAALVTGQPVAAAGRGRGKAATVGRLPSPSLRRLGEIAHQNLYVVRRRFRRVLSAFRTTLLPSAGQGS